MLHLMYADGTTSAINPNHIKANFDSIKLLKEMPNLTGVLLEGASKDLLEIISPNTPMVKGTQVWYFGDMAKFVAFNLVNYSMKFNSKYPMN